MLSPTLLCLIVLLPLDRFTDRQDGPFVQLLGNVELTWQRSRIVA
jgi:hypothetical protein